MQIGRIPIPEIVKNFRVGEIKTLPKHLARFGPLPPATSSTPVDTLRLPNPFLPRRNANTGRWAPPKYSLRRQAILVKQAKWHQCLHLMPSGPKFIHPEDLVPEVKKGKGKGKGKKDRTIVVQTPVEEGKEFWESKVEWTGNLTPFKPTAGSETGTRLYSGKKRMFKGHKWERVKYKHVAHQKHLLRDMPKRVEAYRTYYNKKRPPPISVPKITSFSKLPF